MTHAKMAFCGRGLPRCLRWHALGKYWQGRLRRENVGNDDVVDKAFVGQLF
jgi:hypothetical protein